MIEVIELAAVDEELETQWAWAWLSVAGELGERVGMINRN